jgi:uncharacterized protein (TIGR00251 family)
LIPIQVIADGLTLPVRVTPRASKNALEAFQEGDTALKIKTTAVPEDGKANLAVQKILSEALGIRKTAIFLIQGETFRNKVFKVQTENPQAVLDTLAKSLAKRVDQGFCFQINS